MVELSEKVESQEKGVPYEAEISNKRIASETEEPKKVKKSRRRRNYDELDEQIAKGDKESKNESKSGAEESDSDVDDEKLDRMMAKEEEEEDDLSEIDTANIIATGRRTRGKVIDYKKTAEKLDNNADGKTEEGGEDEDDGEFTEMVTEK